MCGKLCELMLRICCQQQSVSPFFLGKNPLKNVRSIQFLQDCQMFIIVFVKTSVNHFFSRFIFSPQKITSITISRVVQPNMCYINWVGELLEKKGQNGKLLNFSNSDIRREIQTNVSMALEKSYILDQKSHNT